MQPKKGLSASQKPATNQKTSSDTLEDGMASSFVGYNQPVNAVGQTGLGDIYIGDDTSDKLSIGDDVTSGNAIWTTPNTCYPSSGGLLGNQGGLTINNPNSSGITFAPPGGNGWGGSSTTVTMGQSNKYSVMDLPREDMPEEVYVCGRLLTLGLLGTDVECAYTGGQVIFQPGMINALVIHERKTIILKYADESYHYNVQDNYTDSTEVMADLVSTVPRGKRKRRVRKKVK